uniref:C1q domain-containing protein n=1 Tax=Xiphophorus couchianus TaxID=32473 RepID=A0A3B5KX56_9TELE
MELISCQNIANPIKVKHKVKRISQIFHMFCVCFVHTKYTSQTVLYYKIIQNVAFGASISAGENSENIGPFNTHTTVIYKKVYFNTGSFNRGTGIFTAPVKGAYYFSFSGHNLSSKAMGLQLMKNGQQMVTVVNHVAGNRHETATNGMTLQLEVGDQVYMRLYENTWIFDNSNDHSTFIGYLLFPL